VRSLVASLGNANVETNTEQGESYGCALESCISSAAPPPSVGFTLASTVADRRTKLTYTSGPSAGQLAVSDKTISRKHITIKVDSVPEGGGV
jgi:hypothetical protein